MLSKNYFNYFQPCRYSDDGINVDYYGIPEEMKSFQAFLSEDECRRWLKSHGYNPDDFAFHAYHGNGIEDAVMITGEGDVIPKIEEFDDDDIADMIADEVMFSEGSIDNLALTRQDGESLKSFIERAYEDANDMVNEAICSIEESGEYDFSSYVGMPDTDWYDGARDEAVRAVVNWMIGEKND